MNNKFITTLVSGFAGIVILTGCSGLLNDYRGTTHEIAGDSPIQGHPQPAGSGIGVQIADYVMSRWPDPDTITSKHWEYTNGIVLSGIGRIYEKTGDRRYLEYIKTWVDRYVNDKGKISPIESQHNLDVVQPANLLFILYNETREHKYRQAAEYMHRRFASFPTTTQGGFWHKDENPYEMWLDGQYMAIPFLIRYGSYFSHSSAEQEKFYTLAVKQLRLVAEHTINPEKNLFYHAWDEDRNADWASSKTGTSPHVWSRAMGWYVMALVETLEYLPPGFPGYEDLRSILASAAQGLRDYQDPRSGLWHQVIDKGDRSDNWEETSGSAMFVYALKKAAVMGYIDLSYSGVAEKGWNGIRTRIGCTSERKPVIRGSVQAMGVQKDYAGYVNKKKVDNLPHGLAAVMMAASVMEY